MKTLKTLLLALAPAVVLALGSVTLSGCGQSEAARIVAVDDRSVTVETATEGPKTHEVAPDAKITLDGKPAELDDLQPGDKVKVKTNQEGTLEGPQEFAVVIDAKRAEESPAGHEAERTAPADEAITPPQESGLNEPQPADENQPRSDESEPAAPAEEAVPAPQEPALNEPRAEEESQPSSDEAEPAAPADGLVPPPQESGANEPNATEEKESRSGDGAAASIRNDSPRDSQRGMSVVPGDAEKSGIRVRAPFVAVDINIGDDESAADDTPGRMSDVLGMAVKDTKGQQLGTVEDVVVGVKSGQIRYAALAFGGFLGIGDQLVAVPWESLKFQHNEQGDETYFLLDVDEKALGDFPRIESDKWPDHLTWEEKPDSESSPQLAPESKQDEPAEKAKSDPKVR